MYNLPVKHRPQLRVKLFTNSVYEQRLTNPDGSLDDFHAVHVASVAAPQALLLHLLDPVAGLCMRKGNELKRNDGDGEANERSIGVLAPLTAVHDLKMVKISATMLTREVGC